MLVVPFVVVAAALLALSMIHGFMNSASAAQNSTSVVSIENKAANSTTIAGILSYDLFECHLDFRIQGDCFLPERGIDYVQVANGTAKLPEYYVGMKSFHISAGYIIYTAKYAYTGMPNTRNEKFLPEDCTANRIGECFDSKTGIVYVPVTNGTAILPLVTNGYVYSETPYSILTGYVILLPLSACVQFLGHLHASCHLF